MANINRDSAVASSVEDQTLSDPPKGRGSTIVPTAAAATASSPPSVSIALPKSTGSRNLRQRKLRRKTSGYIIGRRSRDVPHSTSNPSSRPSTRGSTNAERPATAASAIPSRLSGPVDSDSSAEDITDRLLSGDGSRKQSTDSLQSDCNNAQAAPSRSHGDATKPSPSSSRWPLGSSGGSRFMKYPVSIIIALLTCCSPKYTKVNGKKERTQKGETTARSIQGNDTTTTTNTNTPTTVVAANASISSTEDIPASGDCVENAKAKSTDLVIAKPTVSQSSDDTKKEQLQAVPNIDQQANGDAEAGNLKSPVLSVSNVPQEQPLSDTAIGTKNLAGSPPQATKVKAQLSHRESRESLQQVLSSSGNNTGGSAIPIAATRRSSRNHLVPSSNDDDDIDFDDEDDSELRSEITSPPGNIVSESSERLVTHVSRQHLLDPISKEHMGRKCLVLDLDETLVHSSFRPVDNPDYVVPVLLEGQEHDVYVVKRPGVDEFLVEVGKYFEVVVFTASLSMYADPVLDLLDSSNVVKHRLFRDSCNLHNGNYVKDLSRLGRPVNHSIIIDNSPASYAFHPQNAIAITSWFNDPHDTELLDLIPLLIDISHVEDVSAVLDLRHDHGQNADTLDFKFINTAFDAAKGAVKAH